MKKIGLFAVLFALISILILLPSCGKEKEDLDEKYVLYIGFRETTELETEEIINTVNSICLKHIDGYTMQIGKGGWTDIYGNFSEEQTLIYSFNFTEEEKVLAIANEVLDTIPDSAVLFETQYTKAVHTSSKDLPSL